MINPKTINIKDLVKDGKKVKFSFYRDSEFWYEQEDGFLFPIALAEAQSSKVTFLAEDKAMLFMRWMRKHLDALNNAIELETKPLQGIDKTHWTDYNCSR